MLIQSKETKKKKKKQKRIIMKTMNFQMEVFQKKIAFLVIPVFQAVILWYLVQLRQ